MTPLSQQNTPTQVSENRSSACWSCAAATGKAELFCGSCGRVQAVGSDVDYFEALGVPRKLNIDTGILEKEFYRLSRRLHPDVFARASQREQDWSLANSSLLNDAYRTLKSPVSRTEYLLKLEGVPIGEEAASKKQDRAPADLLEEVFELNMQLEEMRASRKLGEDDPQLRADLNAAKQSFDSRLNETDATLRSLWNKWDAALEAGEDSQLSALKDEMVALLDRRRYIRNLVRDVNEALGV